MQFELNWIRWNESKRWYESEALILKELWLSGMKNGSQDEVKKDQLRMKEWTMVELWNGIKERFSRIMKRHACMSDVEWKQGQIIGRICDESMTQNERVIQGESMIKMKERFTMKARNKLKGWLKMKIWSRIEEWCKMKAWMEMNGGLRTKVPNVMRERFRMKW